MKKEVTYCDICKQESDETYMFKVKSSLFVNYSNCNSWNADMKQFDICDRCLKFIHYKRKEEK